MAHINGNGQNKNRTLAFVWQRALGQRPSGWRHGSRPAELLRTHHLIEDVGAFGWERTEVVQPDSIENERLLTFHTEDYVQTVQAVSRNDVTLLDSASYGLQQALLPSFLGMHEYYRHHVAAVLAVTQLVAEGRVRRAFTPAGGYHLARPAQARHYCVYNDVVVAILALLERGLRVAYVDLDVYHGDVVQEAFAESDDVLTISLHEGPEFLFPGTGRADEIGSGAGRGYTLNLPLPPGAGDEHLIWVVENAVEPVLEQYNPDVLFTQMGLGMHTCAPTAHLTVTTHGFESVWRRLSERVDRWIAVGGTGAHLDVAARAWTLAFAVMAERADELPKKLPQSYRVHWDGERLRDEPATPLHPEHDRYVWSYLRSRVNQAQRAVFPYHGLPQPDKVGFISFAPTQDGVPAADRSGSTTRERRETIQMPKSVEDALAAETSDDTDHTSPRKGDQNTGVSSSNTTRSGRGRRGKRRRGGKGKRNRPGKQDKEQGR